MNKFSLMYFLIFIGLFIKPSAMLPYLPKGAATLFIPTILIMICFLIYMQKKIDFEITFILLLSITILSIFHIIWSKNNTLPELVISFSSFTFFFSSLFIPFYIFKRVTLNQLHKTIATTSLSIALLVFLDAIVRFFFPFIGLEESQIESYIQTSNVGSFYQFKYASIIEFDSNFIAIYCGAFVLLNSFIKHNSHRAHMFIWFTLLLSTLSRSAIMATVAVLILYRLRNLNILAKCILVTITTSLIAFFLLKESALLNDDSLQSKIQILSSLKDIFNRDSSLYLFGYGPRQGQFIYSFEKEHFAHAAPALLVGITGILGTFFYLILWLYMISRCRNIGYLFIYAMMCGFSLFLPFDYCVFIICGSIMAYHKYYSNTSECRVEFNH